MSNRRSQNILACPNCQVPLFEASRCESCERVFEKDGDTPILMGSDISRSVAFEFNSNRSGVNEETLKKVLRDPPVKHPKTQLPYHLDPAHAEVINGLVARGRVLEIGCGGGQSRQFFEGLGFEYIGVDISKPEICNRLQKNGGPDYLCDAHFLPFLNQKFDLVYCAAVFEHLACPLLAAQELYRVLKPGGYFLGNVSFLEPWHGNSLFHMTPLGVLELLTEAEYEIEYIWPGRGYSGYKAMAAMGSQLTKACQWSGNAMYALYRLERKIKTRLKGGKNQAFKDIQNRAQVAGAIDWIALRPSR